MAVSTLKNLGFSWEEKVKFGRGELVLHKMRVRAKTANVAKVNEKKFWMSDQDTCSGCYQ